MALGNGGLYQKLYDLPWASFQKASAALEPSGAVAGAFDVVGAGASIAPGGEFPTAAILSSAQASRLAAMSALDQGRGYPGITTPEALEPGVPAPAPVVTEPAAPTFPSWLKWAALGLLILKVVK